MTKIITFTGAQGTGKTTIRKTLVEYLRNKGLYIVDQYHGIKDSIARDAKNFGFHINEKTDFAAQYYMASRFISADLETRSMSEMNNVDFIVLDRSVLDVIPYSNLSKKILQSEKDIIMDMLYTHYRLYPTELFYCTELGFIKQDYGRSINETFQENIINEFEKVLHHVNQSQRFVTLGPESVVTRLDKIVSYLRF